MQLKMPHDLSNFFIIYKKKKKKNLFEFSLSLSLSLLVSISLALSAFEIFIKNYENLNFIFLSK